MELTEATKEMLAAGFHQQWWVNDRGQLLIQLVNNTSGEKLMPLVVSDPASRNPKWTVSTGNRSVPLVEGY